MKRILIIAFGTVLTLSGCSADSGNAGGINSKKVLRRMTIEEKARFVIGTGMTGSTGDNAVIGATQLLVPGAAGTTYPLERLGIPSIVLADGPAGLRIDAKRSGDEQTYYCTHFPIGTLLASTWNTALIEQVGAAIGQEVKEYGADILLAPAVNIMRSPLCGRNFEYYSEDPVVAGKTSAAYIRGVQSNGVGTSIKHFAGNNQETNRMNNDAHISQRALREIYLKAFEIAVKESQPWTVMTSYNYINGVYTSESKELVTTILRDEWGFEGAVMTDWYGGKDGGKQMWAGNDMLQPGKEEQYDSIVAAVKKGRLDMVELDRNVERVLRLIEKTPRFQGYKFSNKPDLTAHAAVTRQSAAEGMVLLKNNDVLPLDSKIKHVALYGCTSYDFIAGGTGSGNVNHAYVVSLLDGLKNSGYTVSENLKERYTRYIAEKKKEIKDKIEEDAKKDAQSAMLAQFLPHPLPEEMLFTNSELTVQATGADLAIVTLGRLSGEFIDRSPSDFALSDAERKLIEQVCNVYHKAHKQVIVLLNIGGSIETASWKELPDAILCAWQAGQEGGNSVVDVLSGKQSPSGKLPMTWPVNFTDVASSSNFPIDQDPRIDMFSQGKTGNVRNVDYTDYEEDIYVGYRYFDSFDVPVSYPFGYGLSYTTFEYNNAKIEQSGEKTFKVSVQVRNIGKAEGKEIVQLYVSAPDNKAANKPVKELKAYTKTKSLKPGEQQTVEMTVNESDLASFNEEESSWVVKGGSYRFLIGASSQDIRQTLTAQVQGSKTKVHNVMKPVKKQNLLHR